MREAKRPESASAKRAYVFGETCYRCGALIDKLSPRMVTLIFGSQHLERDELPVDDVATWSRWCAECFDSFSASGSTSVVREGLEMKLTKVVLEGKLDVRSDGIINAWVVRRDVVKG